jgi:hypothetical protein
MWRVRYKKQDTNDASIEITVVSMEHTNGCVPSPELLRRQVATHLLTLTLTLTLNLNLPLTLTLALTLTLTLTPNPNPNPLGKTPREMFYQRNIENRLRLPA